MGCWGMGLTQSDEYCEIYERFMECYDDGMEVSEITEEILAEYHREFDDDDGILHDVYFALAKAQWMCCQLSPALLSLITDIIHSGANLAFYRELEATEADLKIRDKNLNKFLSGLQTPRSRPRKRQTASSRKLPVLADLDKGDLFWYRSEGKIYGALVLEKLGLKSNAEKLIAITEELQAIPKHAEDILSAPVYTAAWYCLLLPESRTHVIGNHPVTGHYNGLAGVMVQGNVHFCENNGTPAHWSHTDRNLTFPGKQVADLLDPEILPNTFYFNERLQKMLENPELHSIAFLQPPTDKTLI